MKDYFVRTVVGLFMLSLVLGFSAPVAKASLMTYIDDEAGFQTMAASIGAIISVESFESVTPITDIPYLDMGPFRVEVTSGGLDVADFALPGMDGVRWLRVHTTEFPTLIVFDNPINAFAVDIANIFTYSGGSLSFQLDGGPGGTIVSQASSGERNVFFGVIDTTSSFSTIAISENITSPENIAFDRVQYGIVPEPATVLLLSFGGLSLLRRRKK